LITSTYQVADLVVPILASPKIIDLGPGQAALAAAPEATAERKSQTQEDRLIQLITTAVAPQSWRIMGGQGTIDYFPLTMALVVNQTPDVQEQVADLLAALRRQQDQEVALEIRLISVSDSVMERLGTLPRPEVESPADGSPAPRVTFLDDKQVYRFMEVVQEDQRSNVMQAPKLTVANGQASGVRVMEQHYFVTGLNATTTPDGDVCFIPRNEAHPTGLELSVQPTISADHRSVQVQLKMKQTELATAAVPLFPVTTYIKPRLADGTKGEPVPFTQYVQQPSFDTHVVDTTLSIPEGHTALLGGWRRTHEFRTENDATPPVLSKIPYVNRLYKNVGYGRESQNVLILVTPRIVASEEQEQRAEVLPYPTPLPAPGAAEESEATGPSKAPQQKVARLMEKYHKACAEGHLDEARKLATQALKLDPTCFHK
jgi:type II secretory pathway component GspD/PulD (secretin)